MQLICNTAVSDEYSLKFHWVLSFGKQIFIWCSHNCKCWPFYSIKHHLTFQVAQREEYPVRSQMPQVWFLNWSEMLNYRKCIFTWSLPYPFLAPVYQYVTRMTLHTVIFAFCRKCTELLHFIENVQIFCISWENVQIFCIFWENALIFTFSRNCMDFLIKCMDFFHFIENVCILQKICAFYCIFIWLVSRSLDFPKTIYQVISFMAIISCLLSKTFFNWLFERPLVSLKTIYQVISFKTIHQLTSLKTIEFFQDHLSVAFLQDHWVLSKAFIN